MHISNMKMKMGIKTAEMASLFLYKLEYLLSVNNIKIYFFYTWKVWNHGVSYNGNVPHIVSEMILPWGWVAPWLLF